MPINRLGFGAMRITGRGIWGSPSGRAEALRALARLSEIGVDFIDTADSYGPDVSEELIGEAFPAGKGMFIATTTVRPTTSASFRGIRSRRGTDAAGVFARPNGEEAWRDVGPDSARIVAQAESGHAADPGTSKVAHLDERVGAASIELSQDDFASLSGA